MKKQLCYFIISLLGLSPLLTIAAELQPKKVEAKQLQQRYGLFKKAHQEYDNALKKYQACATNICKQEKKMLEEAQFSSYWKAQGSYQKYSEVDRAYQVCLQQQCPKEYKELAQAGSYLSKRIGAFIVALTIGVTGGMMLLMGGILAGEELIERKTKIPDLIRQYELTDPREKEILEKFWKTKRIEGSLAKGMEISGALRDALAELYYGFRNLTHYQMEFFNDQLRAHEVIVLEPSL